MLRKELPREVFANEVRRQIREGLLSPGDYLQPERKLAEKYAISLRVVREGLAQLVAEKWIRRHQGRGTIVLEQNAPSQVPAAQAIAVIFLGRVRDTSTAELFDGLQQGFQKHGYGTTLYVNDGGPEKETEIFRQLVRARTPGAVLFSAHPADSFAHLARARDAGMKLVVIDHDFPDFECDSVSVDDQVGGYEAALHLIRLGCTELIHVTTRDHWTSCLERRKGFEMAVQQAGGGIESSVCVLDHAGSMDQLGDAVRKVLPGLFQTAKRPLGVFALHDLMAIQVMECARATGLAIPGDVAVVGFDNDLEGALAEVPLTSVEIPREEIAARAVELLLSQLAGERRAPLRVKCRPRLIIRESCGCYPVAAGAVDGEKTARRGRAIQTREHRKEAECAA